VRCVLLLRQTGPTERQTRHDTTPTGRRLTATLNETVVDSRLRPRCCQLKNPLIARKVVPCVRWPATGITAHSL